MEKDIREEIKDIEQLKALELEKVSGGGDIKEWEIYGVTCDQCGAFGLWEYDCSCVGRTWTVVYKCPSCGGYTFKTLTVPEPT